MHINLKKAIVNFMLNNIDIDNLVTETAEEFRQYIYKKDGKYCIGGEEVYNFISAFHKL